MIATLFGKKKITEERLANAFVNAVMELTAEGFPIVAEEINDSPEFIACPGLRHDDDERFARIVLTGNLIEMKRTLGAGMDRRVFAYSVSKFAAAFHRDAAEVEAEVCALEDRMARLNHPSRVTTRAMATVFFHDYDLFPFQDAYFREQRTPNPIVLKRLTALMGYFIWDWAGVCEQFRVV